MAALLGAYLEAAASRPFAWGDDCGLFVADWVRIVTGADPAAPWRGHYASAAECLRLVRPLGGYVGAFRAGLAALPQTAEPCSGDVALVSAPTGRKARPCGAIRAGRRWALRARDGLLFTASAPLICAWSVGYA